MNSKLDRQSKKLLELITKRFGNDKNIEQRAFELFNTHNLHLKDTTKKYIPDLIKSQVKPKITVFSDRCYWTKSCKKAKPYRWVKIGTNDIVWYCKKCFKTNIENKGWLKPNKHWCFYKGPFYEKG